MDKILSNSKKEEKRCKSVVIPTFIFIQPKFFSFHIAVISVEIYPAISHNIGIGWPNRTCRWSVYASTKNVFVGFKSVLTYCYSYLSSSFVDNVGHSAYNTMRFRSQEDEGKCRFKYRKKKKKKKHFLFNVEKY